MTDIYFSNSLTRKKEQFIPIEADKVGMYVCGPTVYDRAHIGNARAVVVFDVMARILKHDYEHVTYVRNITDVDDKINKASFERNIPIEEITKKTTKMFHDDMRKLCCMAPDKEPKATKHIKQMVQMIKTLIDNGHAYAAEGHVLFNVASDSNYGVLSGRSKEEMIAGARVEVAPYKKDPADFVLWKPSSEQEPGWHSPWGRGRPGWHIECSAMSTHYLGQNFDIHGGGADLQFPHHENEIAQSCCANKGSSYAKYWVHNGFLTVDGEKMSKSLGNFMTVHDALQLSETNYNGQTIRLLFLLTHYKKPLDWNTKSIQDAKKQLDYLYQTLKESFELLQSKDAQNIDIADSVLNAIRDDMNTPLAIKELLSLAKQINKTTDAKEKVTLGAKLKASGEFLGLFHSIDASNTHSYIPSSEWFGIANEGNNEINDIINAIQEARNNKDYHTADTLRKTAEDMGFTLEYKPDGSIHYKKSH